MELWGFLLLWCSLCDSLVRKDKDLTPAAVCFFFRSTLHRHDGHIVGGFFCFQAALTETAAPIIEASEELQELKAEIIKEILASNAKSQQENETNLYKQISQRLQQQTQQHIQQHWTRFSGSLKTLLLLGFVVQSVLLTIVIVVSR